MAVTVREEGTVFITPDAPVNVTARVTPPATVKVGGGQQGDKGTPGIQGPPGGPTVIAVPAAQWPPADPQPDTLYLKVP